MSTGGEILVGLAMAVGIVGVVVPVLPGSLLVGAAIAVWAYLTGGTAAWVVLTVAVVLLIGTALGKYAVAERHLRGSGVPRASIVWGGAAGIVGFFVLPVVGLVVGFVLGVYVAERRRFDDHDHAWRATIAALKASGLAMLIELAGALLAAGVWLGGLVAT